MNTSAPKFILLMAIVLSLLFCAMLPILFRCSEVSADVVEQDTTENVTEAGFDQQLSEEVIEIIVNPDPLSFEELKSQLSTFQNASTLLAFGGYSLSSSEEASLASALNVLEERGYSASFVMMDLVSGYGVAYHADDEFYAASSIKGIYIASLAAYYPESVQARSDLMYSVLDHSNDEDYFDIRSSYGHDPAIQWCEEAGVDSSLGSEYFPYCSARTFAKLWLRNYEYFESDSEESDLVMSWYNSTFKSAIYENLGERYTVCSKGGWIGEDGYYSAVDSGIVYAGDYPYLMVVMSDAPGDITLLEELILALDAVHDNMPVVYSNS